MRSSQTSKSPSHMLVFSGTCAFVLADVLVVAIIISTLVLVSVALIIAVVIIALVATITHGRAHCLQLLCH